MSETDTAGDVCVCLQGAETRLAYEQQAEQAKKAWEEELVTLKAELEQKKAR